jgi:virulence factor Mce-like protein
MREGRIQRLTASPVLVGALTTLIVIVAVFLAYNANNGLPFVPTYKISVEVPDANSLVKGNDVRVGGVRVGTVQTITPVQHRNGTVSAKLALKLDKTVDPIPVDSTFVIRSRSALGLKYLQLDPGHSKKGLPEGGGLSQKHARPEPVEIDQLFNTFQAPVRTAIQHNLVEFGDAVAGRGPSLNEALVQLRLVVDRLVPVMRNLSSPQTDLAGFFHGLEQISAETAPVAETQAQMFLALDRTFGALAGVAVPFIQDSITNGVAAETATITTLPRIRPFLKHSATFFTALEPGARALAANAPALADAFTIGTPVLLASPTLNAQLPPTAATLLAFGLNPGVNAGIDALKRTFAILNPTLAFITPAQTTCHYGDILLRNSASMTSQGDGIGKWLRSITIIPPFGSPNAESGPSSAPANGPDPQSHLHYNPYPNTAAPGQTHECEAGREPYILGRTTIGNPPGNQGTP